MIHLQAAAGRQGERFAWWSLKLQRVHFSGNAYLACGVSFFLFLFREREKRKTD